MEPTQAEREAATRRFLGIGARARLKHARRSGSTIERATGSPVGTTAPKVDGATFIPKSERHLYSPDGKANYILPDGSPATIGQSRETLLVVQLKPAKPEWTANHRELSADGIIPEGYRQPGEPTDARIIELFAHRCKVAGISIKPATNPDEWESEEESWSIEDDIREAKKHRKSRHNDGWYLISGASDIIAKHLYPTPWFIKRIEQPLDLRQATIGQGSGPLPPQVKKRLASAKRDQIEYREDIRLQKKLFSIAEPESEIIRGILTGMFSFSVDDPAIAPDGWAFRAAMEYLRIHESNPARGERIKTALEQKDQFLLAEVAQPSTKELKRYEKALPDVRRVLAERTEQAEKNTRQWQGEEWAKVAEFESELAYQYWTEYRVK